MQRTQDIAVERDSVEDALTIVIDKQKLLVKDFSIDGRIGFYQLARVISYLLMRDLYLLMISDVQD